MNQRIITIENINEIMKNMINDPKSMQLWAEIIICDQNDSKIEVKLTAMELQRRLGIGKSVLYSRLNNLVEQGVIEAEIIVKDTKKKKRVPETIYKINRHFNEVYNNIISDVENQIKHIRDYRLFHLYLINSLLMREIRILSEKTNGDIAKTVQKDYYYGKMSSLTKEEHDLLQEELKKAHSAVRKVQEKAGQEEEKDYLTFNKKYFYYSGFLRIN